MPRSEQKLPGRILGRIGSGEEASAANGIAHFRLGASHLRGVSVPRTFKKAYVAEEFFAYSMGSCPDGVPGFIVEGGRVRKK